MFGADEEMGQDIDRLNQWLATQKPLADWHVDPMVAPTAKSLAGFVNLVKPVNAAMARPRDVLELKDIVRHFEIPAAQLEKLAQRRSLAELDRIAHRYDDAIKQNRGRCPENRRFAAGIRRSEPRPQSHRRRSPGRLDRRGVATERLRDAVPRSVLPPRGERRQGPGDVQTTLRRRPATRLCGPAAGREVARHAGPGHRRPRGQERPEGHRLAGAAV